MLKSILNTLLLLNATGVVSCILKILILGLVAAKVFVQVDINRKFTSFPFAFASNTTPAGFATVIITKTLEDETISWYKKTRVTLPKHF